MGFGWHMDLCKGCCHMHCSLGIPSCLSSQSPSWVRQGGLFAERQIRFYVQVLGMQSTYVFCILYLDCHPCSQVGTCTWPHGWSHDRLHSLHTVQSDKHSDSCPDDRSGLQHIPHAWCIVAQLGLKQTCRLVKSWLPQPGTSALYLVHSSCSLWQQSPQDKSKPILACQMMCQ